MKTIIKVIGIIVCIGVSGCDYSAKEVASAEKQCVDFIKRNLEVDNAKVSSSWTKHGKIVVDVWYKRNKDTSTDKAYNSKLCTVDFKKGIIELLSIFESSKWQE